MSPFQNLRRLKFTVSHFWFFGCDCYIFVPDHLCSKFDKKAIKCIFLGYNSERKGWRYCNPTLDNATHREIWGSMKHQPCSLGCRYILLSALISNVPYTRWDSLHHRSSRLAEPLGSTHQYPKMRFLSNPSLLLQPLQQNYIYVAPFKRNAGRIELGIGLENSVWSCPKDED